MVARWPAAGDSGDYCRQPKTEASGFKSGLERLRSSGLPIVRIRSNITKPPVSSRSAQHTRPQICQTLNFVSGTTSPGVR